MKSLLNDLDAVAGKTAYQSYVIEHGIEKIAVLVPLKNAKLFEESFKQAQKDKDSLLEAVVKHGGKVKA